MLFQVYVIILNLLMNLVVPFAVMGVLNYMVYLALRRTTSVTTKIRRSLSSALITATTAARMTACNSVDRGNNAVDATEAAANTGGQLRRSGEHTLRKREVRITRTSVALTLMFLICHAPRFIPNITEIVCGHRNLPKVLTENLHMALT